jgi:hypothetical protein
MQSLSYESSPKFIRLVSLFVTSLGTLLKHRELSLYVTEVPEASPDNLITPGELNRVSQHKKQGSYRLNIMLGKLRDDR